MPGFVLNTITSQPLFSNTPVLPVASYLGSDDQIIAIQFYFFSFWLDWIVLFQFFQFWIFIFEFKFALMDFVFLRLFKKTKSWNDSLWNSIRISPCPQKPSRTIRFSNDQDHHRNDRSWKLFNVMSWFSISIHKNRNVRLEIFDCSRSCMQIVRFTFHNWSSHRHSHASTTLKMFRFVL